MKDTISNLERHWNEFHVTEKKMEQAKTPLQKAMLQGQLDAHSQIIKQLERYGQIS